MQFSLEHALKQTFVKFADGNFLLRAILIFTASAMLSYIISMAFEFCLNSSVSSELFPTLTALLIVVFLLAFMIFDVFFRGFGLNLAKNHAEGKALSFKESIEKTWKRILPAFLQEVLIMVLAIVFLLIVFSPIIASAFTFFSNPENLADLQSVLDFSNPTGMEMLGAVMADLLIENAGLFMLGIILCLIALVAFLPSLLIAQQIIFFEKISVIESLKRAVSLGFKNFFKNYAFAILFAIPTLVAFFIIALVATGIAPETETNSLRIAASFVLVSTAQALFFSIVLLFSVNIYRLDALEEKPVIAKVESQVLPEKHSAARKPLARKKSKK